MARLLRQTSAAQADFAARISQKQRDKRSEVTDRISGSIPVVGEFLGMFSGLLFDIDQHRKDVQGQSGEIWVRDHLIRYLPDTWIVFHDAVIATAPETFAQIDQVLIGPPGVFLIETKAWRGSFAAYRDEWKQRDGRRWEPCASPTKQSLRHANLMGSWLSRFWDADLPPMSRRWTHPLVVFTHADWLGVNGCAVQVFHGVRELLPFLQRLDAQTLSSSQVDTVAGLIASTPTPAPKPEPQVPLCPKCNIPMVLRTSRQGRYEGQSFYGCRNFPSCREIIQLPAQQGGCQP